MVGVVGNLQSVGSAIAELGASQIHEGAVGAVWVPPNQAVLVSPVCSNPVVPVHIP